MRGDTFQAEAILVSSARFGTTVTGMSTPFPVRRACAAATLTVTVGALLLPAAPASAAPVEGDLAAFAYGKTTVAGCSVTPGPVNEQKTFTRATGTRTARVARNFLASDATTDSARGRVENSTSGRADARNGAFDKVTFTARQLVRIKDLNALDCRLGVLADSQSSATLRVKRRGRVLLEWDRGRAGQIEQIYVARNGAAAPIVNRTRPRRHGALRFRVRPGSYNVFVKFQTRANETDIPAGSTLTKRARFRVALDYRR